MYYEWFVPAQVIVCSCWFPHMWLYAKVIFGEHSVLKTYLNKLGARTLGAHSRGSKNVTYRQQTTDKKVNTEPL